MESLDFIADIAETLKKQKIDYFIITVRKGKFNDKVDIFQSLADSFSALAVLEVFNKIKSDIEDMKTDGAKIKLEDTKDKTKAKIKSKKKKPKKDEDNGSDK